MSTSRLRTGLSPQSLPDYRLLASQVAARMNGFLNRKRTNVGLRIFDGRCAATFAVDAASGTTFQAVFRIAHDADWVEPIFANGSSAVPFTIADWQASVITDSADLNNNNGQWSASGGSVDVPVSRGASRRKLVAGSRGLIYHRPRTDNGTENLIAIRANIAAGAGTITILGAGLNGAGQNFTNWASRPDGVLQVFRAQTGAHVTAKAGFTSVANVSYSPIVGLRYGARGRVITLSSFGDSIDSGQGTYKAEGFIYPALREISDKRRVAVEYANFAWAGENQTSIANHLADAIADGFVPELCSYPNGTPNSTNAPLTENAIIACRWRLHSSLSALTDAGGVALIRTWLPTNPAQKDWNATDSLRRAYNEETLGLRNRGFSVFDAAAIVRGATDADSQELLLTGTTDDDLHLNDYGNSLLKSGIKAFVQQFL